jgi:hypothetical protein
MQRSIDVGGMHKDDITREVIKHLDGLTITDGLGRPLTLAHTPDDETGDSWISVTDHKGRTGRVFVGIGR